MTATDTLPLDWDEWRKQWNHWTGTHNLKPVRSPFRGKNFLADEILGTYRVNGRVVEISELTFPNLSERDPQTGTLLHYNVRRIGLTFEDATAVVGTFAELEDALGIGR